MAIEQAQSNKLSIGSERIESDRIDHPSRIGDCQFMCILIVFLLAIEHFTH